MEEGLASDGFSEKTILFNSPLETGLRAVVVLNAIYPRAVDLAHLTWFDHLVVHTADVGGPASLHPDIPQRSGELLVRRRLVEDGLRLMRCNHLLEAVFENHGILYRACEEAGALVESLQSDYSSVLKARAEWLANFIEELTEVELAKLISERIGRWTLEFQNQSLGQSGIS